MALCIKSRAVLATLAACLAAGGAASADEVTMRLVGSKQTFTGDLLGFDGKYYFIATPVFGKTYLDAKRFECIAGACPDATTSYVNKAPAQQPTLKTEDRLTPREDRRQATTLSEAEKEKIFRKFMRWRKGTPE